MERHPTSFIKQNIELFGFQNKDEALYTTFVEVLDNCIDAILSDTNTKDEEREISISLTPSSSSSDKISLSAVDNGMVMHFFSYSYLGIGMEGDAIPSLLGGIFTSSKSSATQHQTIGTFGVGMKAILLYYNALLTVSSSTIHEHNVTSYCLRVDDQQPTNALQVVRKRSIPKPVELQQTLSGTNIRIDQLVGDLSTLYSRICIYFQRLIALYPPFLITIRVSSFPPLCYVYEYRHFPLTSRLLLNYGQERSMISLRDPFLLGRACRFSLLLKKWREQ